MGYLLRAFVIARGLSLRDRANTQIHSRLGIYLLPCSSSIFTLYLCIRALAGEKEEDASTMRCGAHYWRTRESHSLARAHRYSRN